MAYNRKNHLKRVAEVMQVYNMYKQPDIPDTRIIANKFPLHGIHISYNTFVNYKRMRASEFAAAQLRLFK